MKILVLSQPPRGSGGSEKVVSDVSRKLAKRHELALIYPDGEFFAKEVEDSNFPFHGREIQFDMRWHTSTRNFWHRIKKAFDRLWSLRQAIQAEEPDIIWVNTAYLWLKYMAVLAWFRLLPAPMVLGFQTRPFETLSTKNQLINRIILRPFDRIVGVGRGVASELVDEIGVSPKKVTVIYNPVNVDEVRKLAGEPVDDPILNQNDVPVILSVIRLNEQKNPALLLEAFSIIRETRPAKLMILGDGWLREDMEGLAASLGLDDDVIFKGWEPNPFKYMRRATLFLLSSDYEGYPLVLLEALACGCPIVSTRCPHGPEEILDDGRFGLLAPVGDAEALAEVTIRMLADSELREGFAKSGPDRARQFNLDATVRGYESLFLELAGEK